MFIIEDDPVITDTIYRRLFAFRRILETVSITDACGKQARKLRCITNAVIVTDTVSRLESLVPLTKLLVEPIASIGDYLHFAG